jgi:hypothetical protein
MTAIKHLYEVRPRKDHRGVDLISDALPFGQLWYGEPNAIRNAIYAKFRSRSHVTRLYEQGGDSCRIGDYVQRGEDGWKQA